jgi:hypothetical protein
MLHAVFPLARPQRSGNQEPCTHPVKRYLQVRLGRQETVRFYIFMSLAVMVRTAAANVEAPVELMVVVKRRLVKARLALYLRRAECKRQPEISMD